MLLYEVDMAMIVIVVVVVVVVVPHVTAKFTNDN